MARTGMAELILLARAMADAGTAEHSVAGTTYYTDDQIQARLDRYRMDVYREPLASVVDYAAGSAEYHQYYYDAMYIEQLDSGTALPFYLTDGNGSVVGTASYTVDYDGQRITFSSNTSGSAYYLTYRKYDMERTVASIWREKAAHVADRFDVRTDNHDLKRSQLAKAYMDKANEFMSAARPFNVRMVREDLN